MATTAFHLGTKPSLQLTVDEAAMTYQLPALKGAIATFANGDTYFQGREHAMDRLCIWHKTLHAILPLTANPYG
ncbi:hypothetical protein EDC04DRAFT_2905736 [Pisolithus marmoratus]|nr:hypothetical protein EDC04DRAFT_2905736 [Pisolithus marmoratus]